MGPFPSTEWILEKSDIERIWQSFPNASSSKARENLVNAKIAQYDTNLTTTQKTERATAIMETYNKEKGIEMS